MPELPDVESFRRRYDARARGMQVESARVLAPEMLDGVSARAVQARLRGRTLGASRRHGKYLFVNVDGTGWLVLHFGMTGDLEVFDPNDEPPSHTRLRVDARNGTALAYRDMRKLGKIAWTDDPDAFVRDAGLGPDALARGFGAAAFRDALKGRRGGIKAALMDQSLVAGIGNVYADEILFQARLHPETPVAELDDGALERLHRTARRVLERAIRAGADPDRLPASYLLPRRRAGAECPRCGETLDQTRIGGRTSILCPREQRRR